jgi:hypothetical protein
MLMSPLLIAAAVLSAPAPAEDFGAARAKALAPYIDDQTFAVVRIDLTRADPDGLAKLLREFGALDPDDEKEYKPAAARWLSAFKKAGGRELNYVLRFPDPAEAPAEGRAPNDDEPFLVVPLADGADVKGLADLLADSLAPMGRREKVGAALVAGDEATLKRLRTLKAADRPALAKAFAAAGDGALQAVLLPPPRLVKLIDEHVPDLPKELGGTSTRPFTEGVQWAALGLDAPPKLGLRLTVRSPGAESAKALDAALAPVLKAIAADKNARAAIPEVEKVISLLTPTVEGSQLVLALDEKQARAALGPVARWAVASAMRIRASNNMHQLNLAAINHADANGGTMPAVATFDKAGKPLLSWRVHLLPYLDQNALYKEFHLDEPWDSDHNKKLIAKMPAVFRGASRKLNEQGKTTFLAPTGKGTAWPGGGAALRYPASFTDGTSNTILFVLADDDHAVEWTKPDDLKIDPDKPHAGLGKRAGTFVVGIADGSVRFLKPTISKETLWAAFTPDAGDILGSDW